MCMLESHKPDPYWLAVALVLKSKAWTLKSFSAKEMLKSLPSAPSVVTVRLLLLLQ